MTPPLSRRVASELLGTGFLVAAVVGSGIMGEELAGGNVAIPRRDRCASIVRYVCGNSSSRRATFRDGANRGGTRRDDSLPMAFGRIAWHS